MRLVEMVRILQNKNKAIMEIGYIGLGKMGSAMVELLLEKGYGVHAFDVNMEARDRVKHLGAKVAGSIGEITGQLEERRTIWIMVPHQFVNDVISEVVPNLSEGDVIVDGGNSPFAESVRRGKELEGKGIKFLDVGVSGGPNGAAKGACMMIGGDRDLFVQYEQLFKDLTVEDGYGYMGGAGAGHFVKMVHNGIEYGMMQAIAEGFSIMKSTKDFNLDMKDIARVYNHGSVIESNLMGWLESGYQKYDEDLDKVSGSAAASGEGEWTVKAAHELGIPDKVIHESLNAREATQKNPSYQGKIISMLRNQFGGHDINPKN